MFFLAPKPNIAKHEDNNKRKQGKMCSTRKKNSNYQPRMHALRKIVIYVIVLLTFAHSLLGAMTFTLRKIMRTDVI